MHILSHLPLARRYGRRYGVNSTSSRIAQRYTYQLGVLVFSFLLVDSLRCHPPFLQNVYLPTSNKTNKEQVAHNTVLTTVTVDANRTGLNWEDPSPSPESSRYCDDLPRFPQSGSGWRECVRLRQRNAAAQVCVDFLLFALVSSV